MFANSMTNQYRGLVRKGGFEPPRPCGRSHLKAVRLPISPLPLLNRLWRTSFSSTSNHLTRFRQVARCFFPAFSRAAAYPQFALTFNGTVPRPCQISLMKQGCCSSHTVQSARPMVPCPIGGTNGPPHDRSDSGAGWTQPCAGTKPKNDFERRMAVRAGSSRSSFRTIYGVNP